MVVLGSILGICGLALIIGGVLAAFGRLLQSEQWRYTLAWYSAFQLVVLGALQFDAVTHGRLPPWQFAFLFWFTILVLIAAFKHRTLLRWWQAWDERGRPIDVEVLDPAPIARHRTF
jgi:hypothetical protein